jgi:trans-aconitate methyltransferase
VTDAAPVRYSASWLTLREGADARARARDLAALAASQMAERRWPVVHDLGCGTGSMARWLAPLLPASQHWVLHDLDDELLRVARAGIPRVVAGRKVSVETRRGDVGRLTAMDLDGAALVTASALLDLLTLEEVRAIAAACAAAVCPALLTLTVTGRVELTPADPLDAVVGAAFDAHQRRAANGRALLGPEAVAAAAQAFTALGARVEIRPSPWRLGPEDADLAVAWLEGWVGAAQELQPDLATGLYLRARLDAAASGRLSVTVQHEDLFASWD